jgi:ATP-dependent protease ClpP protease subunit
MAADERVLTPRCHIGLHEVSSTLAGTLSIQEDGVRFAKSLQDKIVELLCERSTLTPTKLKNMWSRKDVWIDAKEALKMGLIDRIEEL